MRTSLFSLLLGAAGWVTLVSSTPDPDKPSAAEGTEFEGKKVPPLLELTPNNWEAESKASKWLLVKHFR